MKVVLATAPRAAGEIEMAGLPFLGISYIASYLEKFGQHQVVIVDAHSDNLNVEQAANKILACNPQVIGFTATTHNRLQAISVIKLLKKRKPTLMIMVGGPFFSLTDKNTLEVTPEIDCVVRGEGEITTKELLDSWFSLPTDNPPQDKLKNVLGITYRNKNGIIISNPDRPFLKDLSTLPFPAWHLYDLSKYQKKMYGTDFHTIGVISARGCPNFCTFCCNAAYCKSTLRLRHPKSFVDELEFLNKKYGFEAFNIWDDTLTISKQHVTDICREIIKRRLRIKWYGRARVNTIDQNLVNLMKRAGCIRISFGIESGSPRILKVIKKGITIGQARNAVQLCSKAGLITSLNFIVNLPTETMEDLKMTAKLMKEFNKLPNVSSSYGFALIYPGTEMERFAKKNKILPRNFSWNSPYFEKKYKVTGEDPSVPHMEWPGKELEKVKAFMVKNLMSKRTLLKSGWKKIKRIRSYSDLKTFSKTVIKYLNS
jgi:radical SAM superfamily enzyme YgiQ (UPF0313 family)